ncbi:hypothetical protein Lalb_Chr10g0104581 [Lupinus albus]|uniref:Uncharacterized protein n=1 Tax=Lupinus albus TaxID=3870 RepID=A0A6A4PWL9_LUPAL|nr:hypothetical protein Lalb_Chr10g0104581 [Lupinus albus]
MWCQQKSSACHGIHQHMPKQHQNESQLMQVSSVSTLHQLHHDFRECSIRMHQAESQMHQDESQSDQFCSDSMHQDESQTCQFCSDNMH